MTTFPYTNADLLAEAAKQHAALIEDPDHMGVGEQMTDELWRSLSEDDFHDAQNEIHELIENAVDMSAWSVNLGARYLKSTTELAWGRGGDAWDLAVQIAHRPGLSTELRDALTGAIRDAVNLVLDNRGITDTHLLHQATSEETAS